MKRTTLCYIENEGSYLMLHRIKKENDPNEGKWIGIGGKFLEGESADECLLRETMEETGFTLNQYRFRGIVNFISDIWEPEIMYLYTATEYRGEPADCNEGVLKWIRKEDVFSLNLWEGDRIFLKKLLNNEDKFELTLNYTGERLISVYEKPLEEITD